MGRKNPISVASATSSCTSRSRDTSAQRTSTPADFSAAAAEANPNG
jgi:hypothetical protein